MHAVLSLLHALEHGLPVNSVNAKGETPLHDAVAAKSWDVVQELLRLGADKNIAATSGYVRHLLHLFKLHTMLVSKCNDTSCV